jgi:DNA-binding transcriptional regulator YdaS (Cro superfamily)
MVFPTKRLDLKRWVVQRSEMDIQQIKEAGGGSSKLAKELGLHRASVWGWQSVPPRHVLDVERITKIPREELRPDLYRPRLVQTPAADPTP